MRWLFFFVFSSVLCYVLCLDTEQNGIKNTTESTSSTAESGIIWSKTPDTSTEAHHSEKGGTTKGRALNFTFPDTGNTVLGENKTKPLDDLSLDDVPMLMMHIPEALTPSTMVSEPATIHKTCTDKDGKKYVTGEKFNKDCDESCECSPDGQLLCKPRCEPPYFKKGLNEKDAFCQEIPSPDECCVTLKCIHNTEVEPLKGCTHKNQTFYRGEMFNDGCESVCSCGDAGKVQCKPRCPQVSKNSSDQCVHVPDPADPCCTVVFCDVTLGDQDVNKITGTEEAAADSQLRLKSADALNSTSAIIHFLGEPELESNLTAEISEDQMKWNKTDLDGVIIHGLKPGKTYYIRIVSGGMVSNAVIITLPKDTPDISNTDSTTILPNETISNNATMKEGNMTDDHFSDEEMCHFKGQNYTIGQEFNDDCISYCICTENGIHCSPIECPSDFGLDLLDPHCIKWETRPRDFNPVPPYCCPDKVRCLDNGSCKYRGRLFSNWEEIPTPLTGCEKKCFCEFGNVTCQSVCPPVSETPPSDLPCPAQQAMLHHLPGDDCCLFWVCPQLQHPETNKTTNVPEKIRNSNRSQNEPPYLGPYNPDANHKTNGKHTLHNVLAPFGLDESGNPTDPPLPGPVVLPYDKGTSTIPGPPYIEHGEHQKTYGFKSSKDEGIHGPPPFVIKPTKEDFDKKHKYSGLIYEANHKIQQDANKEKPVKAKQKNRGEFRPTTLPPDQHKEGFQDYEDSKEPISHHNFHDRPGPLQPGQPHIIYVNHPVDLTHLPPGNRPLPNEIYQSNHNPNFYHPLFDLPELRPDLKGSVKSNPSSNILDLARPNPIGSIHSPFQPPHSHPHHPAVRRPLPIGLYDGDEEAVLHYHTQDLPDDSKILAKEILAHLHNTQNSVSDHVFMPHQSPNSTNNVFPLHQSNITAFGGTGVPPGFSSQHQHTSQSGVNIQVLEPLDEHTVRLAFSVPPVLVGLHGRVEVRYTSNKHNQDPSAWELQVLAPPGDLIATPQLHFDLGNLLPDTIYSIMIKIILRDLSNTPHSPIVTVRTLPSSSPLTTLPPQISVDSGLAAAEINSTWAKLIWRKFSEFELQFIDGVQLRYREEDGKVFSATPLIHRLVTSYTIEDLKPNSSYEMGLFFIPFPGQTTELQSERNIEVKTPLENDPYKFDINLEILSTKSNSVEVTWSGVPYPEDKYVNIYRVIYQSETGKEDFSTFKVAKRDSTPKMTVVDLKPTTRYRLWLEAYLTNGRTKKSNVQDFVSKPGATNAGPSFQGKLSGTPPTMEPGDYYGPLVAVAILAALAIMAALILLLVLMRKHGQNKAAITSTRKTQSAYDNPSYKTCEGDSQAAGIANGNGVARDRNIDTN